MLPKGAELVQVIAFFIVKAFHATDQLLVIVLKVAQYPCDLFSLSLI